MKTITVQIGNSDDKLTQAQWSMFVQHVAKVVEEHATELHFSGPSIGWASWQNCCYVFTCADYMTGNLKTKLAEVGKQFNQDSIAYTEGTTEFL